MMSVFDDKYIFRLANRTDVDKIMEFIRLEWNPNHIFAKDKELFLWQYGNSEYGDEENINFMLMIDKESGEIVGINGFVKYSDTLNPCVSSAITKVKSTLKIPMSGVELIKRFREDVHAEAYYSSGTNPKTIAPIGKRMFGYEIGVMQQFYVLNSSIKEYKIAEITDNYDTWQDGEQKIEIVAENNLLSAYDFDKRFDNQGYKSKEYIKKRYIDHPVYMYQFWGVGKREDEYDTIIIGREVRANGGVIYRIVDVLGDVGNLGKIGKALQTIIEKNDYEYIDLVAGKLDENMMSRSGFRVLKEKDDNIIPMYFEPFVRKNVYIWYQKSNPEIIIFKADGDQDRPNSR